MNDKDQSKSELKTSINAKVLNHSKLFSGAKDLHVKLTELAKKEQAKNVADAILNHLTNLTK